jgi:hypothetical protein
MRRMRVTSLVWGLIVSLTVALGCFTAWLAWASLDWPITVDGGFFHFVGAQMLLGEVPYRDLFDFNFPLILCCTRQLLLSEERAIWRSASTTSGF